MTPHFPIYMDYGATSPCDPPRASKNGNRSSRIASSPAAARYWPRASSGQYTMSPDEAVQAAATIGGAALVPMHYFDTTVADVTTAAKAQPGVKLHFLKIGETLEV